MSKSKYQPPVNMPEKVPDNPSNPESLIVQFLHSSGQWIGCDGKQLMLYQAEPGTIGLGVKIGDQFRAFVHFPGTLTVIP
jgi:hypothetical protein